MKHNNKKYEFTKEQIDMMILLHDNGFLNRHISQIFNVSLSTINRRLKENNVKSRHPWLSDDRKQEIYECYIKEKNKSKVSKILNVNGSTIDKVLKEYGEKPLDLSHVRMKYHLKEDYFDNINDQNKAYILGLLYADGNVGKKSNSIQLFLQERDKEILEKINKLLESERPLVFINYKDKNPKWQNQYAISIVNKHMHDSLIKQGVVPNKSLILKFPENLNKELYRHFIRGYLDGDGSISKNAKEKRISMVGTECFCNSIKEIIEETLSIHCSICYCHNKDVSTRSLGIAGNNQVKKFLDWIYNDANLYLERKHKIYENLYCA